MRQYELFIQIIIIRIKKMKKKKSNKRKGRETGVVRMERERKIFFYFFFLRFSLRSTKIEPEVFVEAEGKVDPHNGRYAWVPKS